jgi:hypothetical protein
MTTEELFWSHVRRHDGDGCWEWTGNIAVQGYGRIKIGRRQFAAHRLALSIHLGRSLTHGEQANHGCDNRRCVRVGPGHIYLGNQKKNIADAMSRGRMAVQRPEFHAKRHKRCGTHHHNAKLTPEKVHEIRSLRETGWSQQRIADHFGIDQTCVSCVLRGTTWAHVT